MMKKQKYNHKEIEKKWIDKWYKDNIYAAEDFSDKPKKFILVEFPYPSGSKLHMGHVMRYTLPEIYSRKLRMSGFNVMFPMGWDAFGLPAENYAVKTGVHPAETTKIAINAFQKLFKEMGYGIDWSREVNTTDPDYYKWTQWIFLKFWKDGLAELKEEPVWWCDDLKTILANEEVIKDESGNLVAERDGKSLVERRNLKQWVLKMPKYADKLIEGLSTVDFPESVRAAQINWIGKSEGAEIDFALADPREGSKTHITAFTTRLDTIYGATFLVLAPENPIVETITTEENKAKVSEYQISAKKKTELERTSSKEKTGVFTGAHAINPFTGKQMPIWISDFVISTYGTGALMAVPAHDERDYEFAKKFGLEIIQVIESNGAELPYGEEGKLINSGEFSGLTSKEAFEKMIAKAQKEGFGAKKTNYKLRDWLFSRQRYWGEPIPLIHKEDGTVESICDPDNMDEVNDKLPLVLPDVPDYTPSSDATSPLSKNKEWLNTRAKDGSKAERETNTMPNWAGSCWYYLRYIDSKNQNTIADPQKMQYWLPVDKYFGGSEHTTLHLLYSRFWHKFLYDKGVVPTSEPFAWRMNGGILLGPDGEKMSKSKGNVINPDENIEKYGVDALRMYICFMGPYDATIVWNEGGLRACRNLVDSISQLQNQVIESFEHNTQFLSTYHNMIKKVSDMVDNLKMNTAISEFMIFMNAAKKEENIDKNLWNGFLKLIAPFAPFLAEELWHKTNNIESWNKETSIHLQSWPNYDENLIQQSNIKIGVQVNGRLRADVEVEIEESEDSVKEKVLAIDEVKRFIEGKDIKKFIYVKGRIVNIVV